MAAVVLVALAVGLLVFGLLTRRLSLLTERVQRFTESGFEAADAVAWTSAGDDEIDRLGKACAAMSEKIGDQFESLKENDRLRRELISNVSHDLRTPLASIQGYVETLLIKDASLSADERRRYLATTRKHTQHLGRLIGDLFELSKLEAASVEPQFERFSLAELLQDVVQEFELEAREKEIDIRFGTAGRDTSVYADIGLIQRVLENLLRNALKFTPRGGRISVSMDPQPDSVAVTVADTGCGIADEDLPQIFDRFYRTHRSQAAGSNSSGLGLAIVKRILDLHGSRITVSSEIDRGTRFVFDLPTAQAA
jgi:signal transduction histidine kinase